ncbi:MAG: endopeptidase La [Firmicutes bacterium]|nr:endopeptidase La [Bacillota bacterium]
MKKETYQLPLLITRGMVLFPNQAQSIEAGRPFSVAAIDAAKVDGNDLILVTSQKSPEIDEPATTDVFMVGTICRMSNITSLKRYTRLKVLPIARVLITEINKTGDTWTAKAEKLEDVIGDHKTEVALVRNIITSLEGMQAVTNRLPREVIGQLSKGVAAADIADILANLLPMPVDQKQKVLETLELNERLKMVLDAVNEEKEIADIDKHLQEEVRKSAEKNQREYFLREKLKAIKTELGENPESSDSEESLLKRLESGQYPDHVKAKVRAELKRGEMMPSSSLEASLIKSYVELMLDLPWWQRTSDNDDLVNVQTILDADHYGLEKVKKRIIEYLAVKKMTGSLKAPILCFYGPPGVGKTSLARSIARALGRKFFKASLGGISDEAEIRGHRRTYVGSMPGRILNGMKKSGVVNPVFLLDEVDKLASSYKGDPASALLEVLDPEQNFAFNDNYIEEPYDLSNVMFIATANYLEDIPAPLRDRLELIEVNSYTEVEKIEIANRHLIEKQLMANGLKKEQISFTKEALSAIIEFYTREAGVRELERKIASICRKAVVDLLIDNKVTAIKVTPAVVRKYLGVEIFDNSKKEKTSQVGVVTGLAYTQYGGEILPIEVNHFPGSGRLVLTGKLGDVMKESATIALDYIQANATKYGIDSKMFKERDIHIHIPEGAVPKDGPSAGVTMSVAIISALTGRQASSEVAMTGEVTLRGNVLAIGGLREKTIAALRSGIKTVLIPDENKKNVDDLAKEVKDNLKIIYVKNVDEAIEVTLSASVKA